MDFCTEMQIDHTLEDSEVPTVEVLQVFGVSIRDGAFSNRVPGVRADTVAAEWCAVAEVHLLEGRLDPRKPPGSSSQDLNKRLTRMLHHCGYQDPPQREKAIPLGFVVFAATHVDADAFSQCWEDLIVLSLFFCLRLCEYTKTNSHRCTTLFRFRNMQFHVAR